MRKLHLVGLTTDRDGLIFTARKGSKSGGFIVPLDKKVLAAVAEASGKGNGEPADSAAAAELDVVPRRLRSESALTPREMQARLRAGRTIEEVAAEAGVDTEWVARFAVPILAEQAQVVELARGLVYAKPRLGESTQPLGASVLQNLSDRGVFLLDDVAAAGWSAFQLHDSVWMVRFRYRARGRDQEAQWELDVPSGRLRARNRHASDLGYVGPDRWRAVDEAEEPEPGAGEAEPPSRPARRRAAPKPAPTGTAGARRSAAVRRPAAKTAKTTARSVVTKNATGKKAVVKKTVTKKAAVRKTAVKKAVVKKATVKRATVKKAAGKKAAAKGSPRPASPKSATRRRATKAVPAPEAGPGAGSGGVRMAVARVSTARVAASLATADREPWAAAVRRGRPRGDAGTSAGTSGPRPAGRRAALQPPPSREERERAEATVRPFQPRPLPPPGSEPPPSRVRRVTVPRPQVPADGPPALTLPAPRRQADKTESLPVVKRRRLRSR